MFAVYKKDLKQFFSTMTGYIFIAFMLLITGVFCLVINFSQRNPQIELVFNNISFVYIFMIPILTMQTIAAERHQRTEQYLYSLPIGVPKIILGKYLSMITVLFIPTAVTAVIPLICAMYGEINYVAAYGSLIAFFLLGAALTAVGLFISSLTESQLISAVMSCGTILFIFLMSSLAELIPASAFYSFIAFIALVVIIGAIIWLMTKTPLAAVIPCGIAAVGLTVAYFLKPALFDGAFIRVMNAVSMFSRLATFSNGIFDLTAIIYYVSLAAVMLFITIQSVEKRRWS